VLCGQFLGLLLPQVGGDLGLELVQFRAAHGVLVVLVEVRDLLVGDLHLLGQLGEVALNEGAFIRIGGGLADIGLGLSQQQGLCGQLLQEEEGIPLELVLELLWRSGDFVGDFLLRYG